MEGYRQAFNEYGVPVDETMIKVIEQRQDAAQKATLEAVHMENPPTAIIATNQVITLGVLEGCKDSNIRIPDDVSIIGFDDLPWYSLLTPPLTAIQHPINAICERSVEMLSEMMANADIQSNGSTNQVYQNFSDIFLKPKLIERGSCRLI